MSKATSLPDYILEDGEQFNLTKSQGALLLRRGLIYDCGENYFHIADGHTYFDIEIALKGANLK